MNLPEGIILKGIGGFYYVQAGAEIYECKAKGTFRKEGITPLTGDSVDFESDPREPSKGFILRILPRKNELIRPPASNLDQLLIVMAARSPEPDLLLTDKLLATCRQTGIHPVICINKHELLSAGELEALVSPFRSAGYDIRSISVRKNEGIGEIEALLKDRVTALAGQSGVGKSSLLNRIKQDLVMDTGDISEKIGRGKHTTRHAELIPLSGGGWLMDTPGFSSFELAGVSHTALEECYPEFDPFLGTCRFSGCSHVAEPDCAVKAAVDAGQVDAGRYQRYTQIYAVLKEEYARRYKK